MRYLHEMFTYARERRLALAGCDLAPLRLDTYSHPILNHPKSPP